MPQPKPRVLPPTPKYIFGTSYTVRIRQHKDDAFSGLWDLDVIDRSGNIIETISQADNLNICLENLQGRLENDGF